MPATATELVRNDLHIRNDAKDAQITEAITTAKKRMSMMGVGVVSELDPTTLQCIKLYCRFYFNFQGEAQRYFEAFEYMANAMALSSDYEAAPEGDG